MIFETDEVFDTSHVTVQCSSGGGIFNLIVFLRSMCFGLYSFCMTVTTLFHNLHHYTVFEAPTISGNTTVMEGDTLSLDCDASNSQPLPRVAWFSPEGTLITNNRGLEVANISRTQSGMLLQMLMRTQRTALPMLLCSVSKTNIRFILYIVNIGMIVELFLSLSLPPYFPPFLTFSFASTSIPSSLPPTFSPLTSHCFHRQH